MNLKELVLKKVNEVYSCPVCGKPNINRKRQYNKYNNYVLCDNYDYKYKSHYFLIPYFNESENCDKFLISILNNENYIAYCEFYDCNTNDLLKSFMYDNNNYLMSNKNIEQNLLYNVLECKLSFKEEIPYLTNESLERLKCINIFC